MNIARNIAAVIVGYLVFAVSALLLFKLAGIDPHAETGTRIVLLVVVFGAVFSFVAGIVTKAVASSSSLVVNFVLAVLIFAFAAFSALQSSGNHYTQIAAMFVFAPVSILGGYVGKMLSRR